jgi:hypothetical protein
MEKHTPGKFDDETRKQLQKLGIDPDILEQEARDLIAREKDVFNRVHYALETGDLSKVSISDLYAMYDLFPMEIKGRILELVAQMGDL